MSEVREILNKIQSMAFRSKSPLMDNSHKIDFREMNKFIFELNKHLDELEQQNKELKSDLVHTENRLYELKQQNKELYGFISELFHKEIEDYRVTLYPDDILEITKLYNRYKSEEEK